MRGRRGPRVPSVRSRRRSIVLWVALAGAMVPILFPYYWMIVASLKSRIENLQSPPDLLFVPTLENYQRMLADGAIVGALGNSAIIGVGATAVALVIGLPCAFALARLRLRAAATLVLIARMLPGIALVLPWYIMFNGLGWIGTHQALLLSHLSVTLPIVVWLAIGFFEDLSSEVLDAAKVDGCSQSQMFLRIAIPLSRTGIVAAALFAFIYSWNTFLYSLVLGGALEVAPVATYLSIREFDPDWGGTNAVAVLTTWPIILLSLPFSRYLVRGLTAGASKG